MNTTTVGVDLAKYTLHRRNLAEINSVGRLASFGFGEGRG